MVKSIVLGILRSSIMPGLVAALLAAGLLQTKDVNNFEGSVIFLAGWLLQVAPSIFDKFVVKRKLTVAAATGIIPQKVDLLQPPPQATMAPIPNPPERNM